MEAEICGNSNHRIKIKQTVNPKETNRLLTVEDVNVDELLRTQIESQKALKEENSPTRTDRRKSSIVKPGVRAGTKVRSLIRLNETGGKSLNSTQPVSGDGTFTSFTTKPLEATRKEPIHTRTQKAPKTWANLQTNPGSIIEISPKQTKTILLPSHVISEEESVQADRNSLAQKEPSKPYLPRTQQRKKSILKKRTNYPLHTLQNLDMTRIESESPILDNPETSGNSDFEKNSFLVRNRPRAMTEAVVDKPRADKSPMERFIDDRRKVLGTGEVSPIPTEHVPKKKEYPRLSIKKPEDFPRQLIQQHQDAENNKPRSIKELNKVYRDRNRSPEPESNAHTLTHLQARLISDSPKHTRDELPLPSKDELQSRILTDYSPTLKKETSIRPANIGTNPQLVVKPEVFPTRQRLLTEGIITVATTKNDLSPGIRSKSTIPTWIKIDLPNKDSQRLPSDDQSPVKLRSRFISEDTTAKQKDLVIQAKESNPLANQRLMGNNNILSKNDYIMKNFIGMVDPTKLTGHIQPTTLKDVDAGKIVSKRSPLVNLMLTSQRIAANPTAKTKIAPMNLAKLQNELSNVLRGPVNVLPNNATGEMHDNNGVLKGRLLGVKAG